MSWYSRRWRASGSQQRSSAMTKERNSKQALGSPEILGVLGCLGCLAYLEALAIPYCLAVLGYPLILVDPENPAVLAGPYLRHPFRGRTLKEQHTAYLPR